MRVRCPTCYSAVLLPAIWAISAAAAPTVHIKNLADVAREHVTAAVEVAAPGEFTPVFRGQALAAQREPAGDERVRLTFQLPGLAPGQMVTAQLRPGASGPPPEPLAYALAGPKITLGWESDLIAYRTYYGKIDIFGKHDSRPALDHFEDPKVDYHRGDERGTDLLHLGATSGLGGLWLWDGEQPVQLQAMQKEPTENLAITQEVISAGPIRAQALISIRCRAGEREYEVQRRLTLDAHHRFTREDVSVTVDGQPAQALIGPAQTILDTGEPVFDAHAGLLAQWGTQGHANVKTAGEIGMAHIFRAGDLVDLRTQGGDKCLVLRTDAEGKVSYGFGAAWANRGVIRTQGDWLAAVRDAARTELSEVEVRLDER